MGCAKRPPSWAVPDKYGPMGFASAQPILAAKTVCTSRVKAGRAMTILGFGVTDVKLSAIIITRNEAHNIAACLESVAFCDERIVVDSGSDDETVEIAAAAGATVLSHPWFGFGAQKNFALSQAHGDWVLSVDADERVPPSLAAEILAAIKNPAPTGYEINRLSTFLGRPMRHSGWFPDYVLRLVRREKARFSDDPVHERMICDGPTGRLSGALDHHPV